ncbi:MULTISPECIES: SDR family oxidoreductase [Pandoraea]|uniref:Short chain dehydrogenase/reductase family oxidoreductase n=1 Tax=Pandoraea communis TaxID=2508297 RepID=A0A5E4VGZ1_9BURK|nr:MULTISPECIES: SDR family NAD(P)-dependent oxidoreductase [Pandoraea]EON11979.1 short chain dehydrogenase/reductase family oxidoreductase [Pandoraea sp. SD6-2]VVE11558.1 short chain dehydrogenase/reductase family oxidoreductase [Pandoraea communis]
MKTLTDKVAAITGAGSGMGRSLALELARRGTHLALSDIDESSVTNTATACRALGVRVTTQRLDVADRDAVFAWAHETAAAHGKVNLVFNNAGVSLSVPVATMRQEDFKWLMDINFWGVVHGTQAFLPHLMASGEGHIVNTSSLFGIIAMPTQSAYNASKFAVRGFTEALRMELELAHAPVSCTCVHPGGVATNIVLTSRIDDSITLLTGVDAHTHRRRANKLIDATSADAAARQILAGVERNARRVLVGDDAHRIDKLARLLGARYQTVVAWLYRRSAMARKPSSKAHDAAARSTATK